MTNYVMVIFYKLPLANDTAISILHLLHCSRSLTFMVISCANKIMYDIFQTAIHKVITNITRPAYCPHIPLFQAYIYIRLLKNNWMNTFCLKLVSNLKPPISKLSKTELSRLAWPHDVYNRNLFKQELSMKDDLKLQHTASKANVGPWPSHVAL